MKNVLVTGASGFIGRHLVASLPPSEFRITAVVGQSAPIATPVAEVIALDLSRPVNWTPLIEGADAIIHLAGIAHRRSVDSAAYDFVNVNQTTALATAAARCKVERFVFVSSIAAQVGPAADGVIKETDQPKPADLYGRSKLTAEDAIRAAGVPFTIFRPVIVYGAGVKGNLRLLQNLAASPWPLPFGGLHNKRTLVSVENLISAIRFALATPATAGEQFLVADPTTLAVREIVSILREGFGRHPRLVPIPSRFFELLLSWLGRSDIWERLGGSLVVVPDKLMSFGWKPQTDTLDGLKAMIREELSSRT
jgi:UDP-glucose 4-epimerase